MTQHEQTKIASVRIETVQSELDRRTVRRLFGEYQRGVTDMLAGTDICP